MKSLTGKRPYQHLSDEFLQTTIEDRASRLSNAADSLEIAVHENRISVLRKEQNIRGHFLPTANAQGGVSPPYHPAPKNLSETLC